MHEETGPENQDPDTPNGADSANAAPALDPAETDPAVDPAPPTQPADAATQGVGAAIMAALPDAARPYAQLARLDRPVGFVLLALPCWIGFAFARIRGGWEWFDPLWLILFFIGAVAMRGAGCTWNDIMDRRVDAEVARTAGRPLPSGQVSTGQAWMFLAVQVAIGFLVWIALPRDAKIVALLAIPLVAAYPFMKRVTWWPQAWLGATFNWGVLIAAATASSVTIPAVILWLGLALWTIGYDTIYASQDAKDDARIGMKSTARLFEDRLALAVFCFYVCAVALIGIAAWWMGAGRLGALTVILFLSHGVWQVLRFKRSDGADALSIFKSNATALAILFVGFAIAAFFGYDRREPAPTDDTAVEDTVEANADPAPADPEPTRPELDNPGEATGFGALVQGLADQAIEDDTDDPETAPE